MATPSPTSTTPLRQILSPIIHLFHRRIEYLIYLLIGALLIAFTILLWKLPLPPWFILIRILGTLIIIPIILFYLLSMVFIHISPTLFLTITNLLLITYCLIPTLKRKILQRPPQHAR